MFDRDIVLVPALRFVERRLKDTPSAFAKFVFVCVDVCHIALVESPKVRCRGAGILCQALFYHFEQYIYQDLKTGRFIMIGPVKLRLNYKMPDKYFSVPARLTVQTPRGRIFLQDSTSMPRSRSRTNPSDCCNFCNANRHPPAS